MSVRTFHLVEAAEPHPLVAKALNAELFERCRIERPVPVHFLPMPFQRGECVADAKNTQAGEIRISDHVLNREKRESDIHKALVGTYLHEYAHRLMPMDYWHNAGFLAMDVLLYLRAGKNPFGRPYVRYIELYDVQDWQDVENCSMGEALDWALKQAQELTESDLSAEACATEIARRYEAWKAWKEATPERLAAEEAQADAAARKSASSMQALHDRIERLKQAHWNWFSGGIVAGMLINLIFFVLAKGV